MNEYKPLSDEAIYVTRPHLPDLNEYLPYLEKIWKNKYLTNWGPLAQEFEKELAEVLGVKYLSIVSNGTLGLLIAIKVLGLRGEIITTPYSFVATAHSLIWNKLSPIFVDVDPVTGNLNPDLIESAITSSTTAIMPVHIYGNPCDHDRIQVIAKKHNLKVIYDAAHAFNVRYQGQPILNWGDISVLSFHATKIFSSIEGGAIISPSLEMKQRVDRLKNFGFVGEVSIEDIGINSKMNEFQAAFGLMQLKHFDELKQKRKELYNLYMDGLKGTEGISFFPISADVDYNYAYFPIRINEKVFGRSRDDVYEELKKVNVYTRRYFYPLISSLEIYRNFESSEPEKLPVANEIANQVLCLPFYPDLEHETAGKIVAYIKSLKR
jgi:dTDP-4-amino-4,6-dideoxygalactose transaminase